jgi:hypothetical protein
MTVASEGQAGGHLEPARRRAPATARRRAAMPRIRTLIATAVVAGATLVVPATA